MAEEGSRVPMSPGLQATLLRAREYAASQSHAQILIEHLLLALTEDADAAGVLDACNVDLTRLRHDVAGYMSTAGEQAPAGTPGAPAISAALTQVLKYATLAAQQGRRGSIDGAIVLAALVGDGKSMGASFLKAQGLTFEAAIKALRTAAARPAPAVAPPASDPPPPGATADDEHGPLSGATTARADEMLARARERIESRGVRTDPHRPPEAPIETAPAVAPQPPSAPPSASSAIRPRPEQAHTAPPVLPPPSIQPVPASPPGAEMAVFAERDPKHGQHRPSGALPAPPPSHPESAADHDPGASPSARNAWAPPPRAPATSPPATPPPRPTHPGNAERQPRPSPMPSAAQLPHYPSAGEAPPAPIARVPWGGEQPSPAPRPVGAPPGRSPHPPVATEQPSAPLASPPTSGRRQPVVELEHISHSVPRRMRQGDMQVVEIRIDRVPLAPQISAARSYALRAESITARAIAVRLRPQSGHFFVDPASPETQWDQATAPGAGRLASEAAIWRFVVMPLEAGPGVLQLTVAARTVGADGVIAETVLPEQTFEVHVGGKAATGWLKTAALAMLAALAGAGLLIAAELAMHTDAVAIVRWLLSL